MQAPHPNSELAGVILCGGRGRRMGRPKFQLAWGAGSLLEHVIAQLRDVCRPIVVVASPEHALPNLPHDVAILRDRDPFAGPLTALAQVLATLPQSVSAAFVTGCDTPFLGSKVIAFLAKTRGTSQAAIPTVEGQHHPLCAVYDRQVASLAADLVARGERRMMALVESLDDVAWIDEAALRGIDPTLACLENLNTPAEYQAALRRAFPTKDGGT